MVITPSAPDIPSEVEVEQPIPTGTVPETERFSKLKRIKGM